MASRKQRPESAVARAAGQIASRLRGLGVTLTGTEGPGELARIEEAVEQFEKAVEARGGDLMVDEPPRGGTPEPDDRHFVLPARKEHEPVETFLERIAQATALVRRHRRID